MLALFVRLPAQSGFFRDGLSTVLHDLAGARGGPKAKVIYTDGDPEKARARRIIFAGRAWPTDRGESATR